MTREMRLPASTSIPAAETEQNALADDLADVARGSSSALSRVYALTSPKLNALLVRMLRNRGEAEEVLQEVYLAVWKGSSRFDASRSSPMTWLVTIARNKAIDRLRSARTRSASFTENFDVAEVPDAASTADVKMEENEQTLQLAKCLDELGGRYGASIRAAFFEGVTYEDLARREGVPVGTMKSWIRRGLLQLRGCMQR